VGSSVAIAQTEARVTDGRRIGTRGKVDRSRYHRTGPASPRDKLYRDATATGISANVSRVFGKYLTRTGARRCACTRIFVCAPTTQYRSQIGKIARCTAARRSAWHDCPRGAIDRARGGGCSLPLSSFSLFFLIRSCTHTLSLSLSLFSLGKTTRLNGRSFTVSPLWHSPHSALLRFPATGAANSSFSSLLDYPTSVIVPRVQIVKYQAPIDSWSPVVIQERKAVEAAIENRVLPNWNSGWETRRQSSTLLPLLPLLSRREVQRPIAICMCVIARRSRSLFHPRRIVVIRCVYYERRRWRRRRRWCPSRTSTHDRACYASVISITEFHLATPFRVRLSPPQRYFIFARSIVTSCTIVCFARLRATKAATE